MGTLTLHDHALDRLYLLPRDTRSCEDWDRRRHLDLAALSDLDLDREAWGVAARLYRDRDPGAVAWLVTRRDAIRAERRRRLDVDPRRSDPAPAALVWGWPRRAVATRPASGTTQPPLLVRKGGRVVEL